MSSSLPVSGVYLSVALSLCLSACSVKALGDRGWSSSVGSVWLGAAEETS